MKTARVNDTPRFGAAPHARDALLHSVPQCDVAIAATPGLQRALAEVKNLRQALQGELPQRQFGSAVRLEVAAECPAALAQFLLQQFGLTEADLYRCDGPVNIARLSSLADKVDID